MVRKRFHVAASARTVLALPVDRKVLAVIESSNSFASPCSSSLKMEAAGSSETSVTQITLRHTAIPQPSTLHFMKSQLSHHSL